VLELSTLSYLDGKRVLITGGTGSLGKKLVRLLLDRSSVKTVVIFSRDEFKQFEMNNAYNDTERKRLRFFLGDVRDAIRLEQALVGVDYVVHAAALKQVPAAEYNPFEFVKTNIIGAENLINAAIKNRVKNVVALSTDKAANPINLYGATKLCSDKLFVSGNSYSGSSPTRFSVVRYGNVVGSRGSVIPFFLKKRQDGELPITHPDMTRFWITLDQGAHFVLNALRDMKGGEVWIPRIPSMRITDLARVIAPECKVSVIGIRPGEKLHEVMITIDDGSQTLQFDTHYIIRPTLPFWSAEWHQSVASRSCPDRFYYGSDNNTEWLDDSQLADMIASLDFADAKIWAKEKGLI